MGVTTLGRERDTNPFLSELRVRVPRARPSRARLAGGRHVERSRRSKRRAAPSTCSASRRRARATLEARARAILEGAGYERIETPAFEATELFARGVGESTDIVRKEMFTFEDAAGAR